MDMRPGKCFQSEAWLWFLERIATALVVQELIGVTGWARYYLGPWSRVAEVVRVHVHMCVTLAGEHLTNKILKTRLTRTEISGHLAWFSGGKPMFLSFPFTIFPLVKIGPGPWAPILSELEIWSWCSAKWFFFSFLHSVYRCLLPASSHFKHLTGGKTLNLEESSIYSKVQCLNYSFGFWHLGVILLTT